MTKAKKIKADQGWLPFFFEAIKTIKDTGSLIPTSRSMSEALIQNCNFDDAKLIVELGVGNGAITSVIYEKLKSPSQYLGVELNDEFFAGVVKKYPDLKFIHGSAENIDSYIAELGFSEVDFIVSALPWGLFTPKFQDKVLDEVCKKLKPGGGFSTIAYWGTHKQPYALGFVKKLKKKFQKVELDHFVWRNFPPGYAYYAKK